MAHWLAGAAIVGTAMGLGTALILLAGLLVVGRPRWASLPVVFVLLATGWLFDRSVAGLQPPPDGPMEGWVTLTADPTEFGGTGVRVKARWGRARVSLVAYGTVSRALTDRLSGEQLKISGSFRGGNHTEWARWQHDVGVISLTALHDTQPGSPLTRFTNQVRRWLSRGAESLPDHDRATFLGMVIGDDRDQSAVIADDFRSTGLGHLLVVSGQNVAFLLAVLEPVLIRSRPAVRIVAVAGALLCFAVLTRFEPSVLRAVGMAGVSVGAATIGLPVDSRKALSLALAGALLVDPFLIRSVAFQLSVAATAGIVWLAGPLAARIPGPSTFRVALATTVAAQVAVAPLLQFRFGSVPLFSLPANLLAGPVSGLIMMWGCTGGLLAGICGGVVADVLHWPTRLMVGWVRWVARLGPTVPPFLLSDLGVVSAGIGVLGLVSSQRSLRRLGAVLAGVAMLTSLMAPASVGPGVHRLATSTVVVGADGITVIVSSQARDRTVVEELRLAGLTDLHTVVVQSGSRRAGEVVVALRERFGELLVVAPPHHQVPTARTLAVGQRLTLSHGSIAVDATTTPPQLRWEPSALAETVDVSAPGAKVNGDDR